MSSAHPAHSDNLPALRHSVGDIEVMAKQVAQSRLFGLDQAQAFTLMLLAQAKGIHPIQAVERYHVIKGKPAMKADAMLADFLANGGVVEWSRHDHLKCEATWSAPGVKTPVTIAWTIEDAIKADLTANDMYRKYPRQMLRSRVISEGIRMTMPGIIAGIYTPEEVVDFAGPANAARDFAPTPRPAAFTNNTSHGSGKYAEPATVKEYQAWLGQFCSDINARWLDHWTDRHTGEIPNGINDLINVWQLSNHLCKWGRALPDSDPLRIDAPEDFKSAQADRLVAIMFDRDAVALEAEAKAYCRKLWAETKADFQAKVAGETPDDESQEVEPIEGELVEQEAISN